VAFAIYYEATRKEPLTERERAISREISEKYCSEYPFKRKVEDFGIYESSKGQNDIIFSGSTKLPRNSSETLFEAANYWLKCLTEITHLLTNAAWNVTFDDVDLIFDLDQGWRFPTDEEYNKQKLS